MDSEVVSLDVTDNDTVTQKSFQIMVKFCFTNDTKRFVKHPHIVQGEPFTWGVKIKNIDTNPTPEATITSASIRDLNEKFFHSMDDKEIYVRSLNPGEEIYIEIDKATVFLEGMQWAEVDIEPKEEIYYFETHQFDEKHNTVKKYYDTEEDKNEWMDSIYIQKKIELLQSKTNNYILLLTIITVWESVFGIKDTLRNIVNLFASVLVFLSDSLSWLVQFL